MKQCSITGCDRKAFRLGLCNPHWQRQKKWGDPLRGGPIGSTQRQAQRFLAAALAADTDECVIWPFETRKGYARARIAGRMVTVSAYVCELTNGRRPSPDMETAHNCNVRACINRRHVRWDTPKGNVADQLVFGTRARGERHARAILTEQNVFEIRALHGTLRTGLIAARYGVTTHTIRDIFTGRHWGWLRANVPTTGEKQP